MANIGKHRQTSANIGKHRQISTPHFPIPLSSKFTHIKTPQNARCSRTYPDGRNTEGGICIECMEPDEGQIALHRADSRETADSTLDFIALTLNINNGRLVTNHTLSMQLG
jgi:hypothetical protein